MAADDIDFDFAKQFWTTANLVVSFSVAQIVAFGIAAATAPVDGNSGLIYQIQRNFPAAIIATLASAICSIGLVRCCQSAARELLSGLQPNPSTIKILGRFDTLRIAATSVIGVASVILVGSIEYNRPPSTTVTPAENVLAAPVGAVQISVQVGETDPGQRRDAGKPAPAG